MGRSKKKVSGNVLRSRDVYERVPVDMRFTFGERACIRMGALTFVEFAEFESSLRRILEAVDKAFSNQSDFNKLVAEKIGIDRKGCSDVFVDVGGMFG